MKKVNELGEKEVIHCKNVHECRAICSLMDEAGLKWSTGCSYLEEKIWGKTYYKDKGKICFRPFSGTHESIDVYEGLEYVIHQAPDFFDPSLAVPNYDEKEPPKPFLKLEDRESLLRKEMAKLLEPTQSSPFVSTNQETYSEASPLDYITSRIEFIISTCTDEKVKQGLEQALRVVKTTKQ